MINLFPPVALITKMSTFKNRSKALISERASVLLLGDVCQLTKFVCKLCQSVCRRFVQKEFGIIPLGSLFVYPHQFLHISFIVVIRKGVPVVGIDFIYFKESHGYGARHTNLIVINDFHN